MSDFGFYIIITKNLLVFFLVCKQMVGLVIGVVPQFRKLLVGNNAPLRVVQDSIVMLG